MLHNIPEVGSMVAKTKKKSTNAKSVKTKSTKTTLSVHAKKPKLVSKVKHKNKQKASQKKSEGPIGFFIKNIEKFEHSIDFDISKGIFAAFIFMLIAEAISFIGFSISRIYYTNLEYTLLWSRFLAPITGQIPPLFFFYSALISLFVGFIYAFFYHMVRVAIHGHAPHKKWVKGLLYGVFLVFVYAIPMMLRDYLMFGVPSLLVVSWFAESVLTLLAGGVVIASIMK